MKPVKAHKWDREANEHYVERDAAICPRCNLSALRLSHRGRGRADLPAHRRACRAVGAC
jgi:hypothetical protein